jgi:hypothetical protein
MSDLLQAWQTQPIPGRGWQACIPSTTGTKSIQEKGPHRKTPEGNPKLVISALAIQQITKLDQAIVQLTGLGMFFGFRKVSQAKQQQTEQLCMCNI